jgi:hypothetical protein
VELEFSAEMQEAFESNKTAKTITDNLDEANQRLNQLILFMKRLIHEANNGIKWYPRQENKEKA